jgi:serine/threonine protein kinase
MTISLILITATYFTTLAALTGISKMSNVWKQVLNRQTTKTGESENISNDFQDQWDKVQLLGRGSDGIVHCYKNKTTGRLVAVKEPVWDSGDRLDEVLLDEIKNLKTVRKHPYIIGMSGYRFSFIPRGPAVVFPLCDLGDLNNYRRRWIDQEESKGMPARISEDTIWKLLHDMSLALDHLHNKLKKPWIHTDVKPGNILVLTPPGYKEEGIPVQPIFKLADFSRLTSYPCSDPILAQEYRTYGTCEFRPPIAELKRELIHPAGDIWSLGATLQYLAFGFHPIQSQESYIEKMMNEGIVRPSPLLPSREEDWSNIIVRSKRSVVFRPLNLPMEELIAYHDVPFSIKDYQPFSTELNEWNGMLMMLSRYRRITASVLAEEIVPFVVAKKQTKDLELRGVDSQQDEPVPKSKLSRAPSYEGNGYGAPSSEFVGCIPWDGV